MNTILIVDKSYTARTFYHSNLESKGYNIISISSNSFIPEIVKKNNPNLIILDDKSIDDQYLELLVHNKNLIYGTYHIVTVSEINLSLIVKLPRVNFLLMEKPVSPKILMENVQRTLQKKP